MRRQGVVNHRRQKNQGLRKYRLKSADLCQRDKMHIDRKKNKEADIARDKNNLWNHA